MGPMVRGLAPDGSLAQAVPGSPRQFSFKHLAVTRAGDGCSEFPGAIEMILPGGKVATGGECSGQRLVCERLIPILHLVGVGDDQFEASFAMAESGLCLSDIRGDP